VPTRAGIAEHIDTARAYFLLVSRVDGRAHAVWYRDVVAAVADARRTTLPSAVCTKRACEPYDPRCMSTSPVACDDCFRTLRDLANTRCLAALRRNFAERQPLAELSRLTCVRDEH
jgi:hypothetical protein